MTELNDNESHPTHSWTGSSSQAQNESFKYEEMNCSAKFNLMNQSQKWGMNPETNDDFGLVKNRKFDGVSQEETCDPIKLKPRRVEPQETFQICECCSKPRRHSAGSKVFKSPPPRQYINTYGLLVYILFIVLLIIYASVKTFVKEDDQSKYADISPGL